MCGLFEYSRRRDAAINERICALSAEYGLCWLTALLTICMSKITTDKQYDITIPPCCSTCSIYFVRFGRAAVVFHTSYAYLRLISIIC